MDEQPVFQSPAQPAPTEQAANSTPSSAANASTPSAPAVVTENSVQPDGGSLGGPPPPVPPKPPISSGFPLATILKVVIGIVILVALVAGGMFLFTQLQKPKDQKAQLEYWGLWQDPPVVQSIINDYQRLHPNVTIKYVKQDIKQYRAKLTNRIQNGTGPDIFRFHNTWVPEVRVLLAPIPATVLAPAEFKKLYYPVTQKDLIRNGAIYGIPLEIDTLALFTNNTILKAGGVSAPTTWDDFVRVARVTQVFDPATGTIKTAGAAMGTYDNIAHASDIVSLLFVQNGVDLANFAISSQPAVSALTFYTAFAQGPDRVWDQTLDPSLSSFAHGNLAMYFGYSWDILQIKAIDPALDFSVAPVPHLPGRNMTIASYWVEGVSARSKYPKESFDFLSYLSKRETMQKMYTETAKTRPFGEPYSRVDMAELLKGNPLIYPFVSQANDATSSYFAADTYDDGLNTGMNEYLGNAVRSVLTNTSPQTAIEVLIQGVTQILTKYGGQ